MKVTHCPNCQTCFKVTDEQLKLYNGKVRCGRCAFVFNALNHLIEVEDMSAQTLHMPPNALRQEKAEKSVEKALEQPVITATSQPPESPATEETETQAEVEMTSESPTPTAATPVAADTEAVPETAPAHVDSGELDTNPFLPRAALQEALSGDGIGLAIESETEVTPAPSSDAQDDFDEEIEITAPDDGSNFTSPPIAETESTTSSSDMAQPAARPFYVEPELELDVSPAHELEEDAPKRPSRVFKPIADLSAPEPVLLESEDRFRSVWLVGSIVAALLLLGQIVFANRTQITVSFPGMKPALEAVCRGFGCSIPLPADDTLISIESSELNPDVNQPNLIRLSATLLNRAEFDQALPMLELTLTDTNDQTVVRKVFEPSTYLDKSHPALAMPAKAELQANLALDIGDLKAAGYRLFLFYPK